jgi:Zn-dependent M28 family amino/carboxypeptidase
VESVYGDVSSTSGRLLDDLDALVTDTQGRLPGSAGDEAARAHIFAAFVAAGLSDVGAQTFSDATGSETANILGVVLGSDPDLADEVIVVSAHHDHLGPGFPGANDNGTGVAALIEIARRIAADPPPRTVRFAAFGAEEAGFLGAIAYAEQPGVIDDVVYAVNLDMLGTLTQAGSVWALGARNGSVGEVWVQAAASDWPDGTVVLGDWSDESDNVAFCTEGVPYVFFWTPDSECYHQACDTVDRIEPNGFAAVTLLAADVVREAATATLDLRGQVQPGEDVCRQVAQAP